MATRSNSICLALGLAILALNVSTASACPFCTALEPTLSQMRDRAAVVALAEFEGRDANQLSRMRLHRVLQGQDRLGQTETLHLPLDGTMRNGALVLLFGNVSDADAKSLEWKGVSADEASYAYFARAPQPRAPIAERLRYYARFLEHANPLVAEDAYLEFGHARFDEVAQAADSLSLARLKAWLADPAVPPHRKGFYGLAIGLTAAAGERSATAEFFRGLIVEPASDFRAGFDGVLGGYLLLAGEPGLALLEERYLANPFAGDGDVRHTITALRFYHEYGRDISKPRLAEALRHLLARPEFASTVLVDLARWKDWQPLEKVAALYARDDYPQPATARAVVGYLLACPEPAAEAALKSLRAADPKGVAAAEQILSQTGSLKSAE